MDKRKFIFGLALFSALIIVFTFNAGLSSVSLLSIRWERIRSAVISSPASLSGL